jgi:CRISPR-associated protein Cas5d
VLDSILWKPEFQWYVRKILVLKPVKFFSIKRNEIKAKQGDNPLIIENERTQRNSIILRDVSYIIEASIYQKVFDGKNPPRKYAEMFQRRVRKGQCFRRPFLGTREFAAEFCEPDIDDVPIQETIPIGSMLFDLVYDENGKPSPIYFYDVKISDGILNCEVPENDILMQSSHKQPPVDSEFSAMIYEFNRQEESEVKK